MDRVRFRRRQTWLTWFAVCLLVLLQLQLVPTMQLPGANAPQTALAASYDNLPLAFEPNQGQADPAVDFLVHHGQAVTSFTAEGARTTVGGRAVALSLVDAAAQEYVGQDELESKTNYFLGNDPSKWQSDVPNYRSLLAKNVYSGIDLTYYGTNAQLEHDFIVAPGADYTQIAFSFAGQDNLSLDDDGNLILAIGDDTLTLQAPKTYQESPGTIRTIPSSFVVEGDTVRFALHADYDRSLPLIIDPVLIYSTYLGGSGSERGVGITVDASDNVYVMGFTSSTNFPTSSPFQAASGGGTDVFISKFNPAGSALVYSTYLGGSGSDSGNGIVVDLSGNAYVTGETTSTNFPTSSPFQAANGGGTDTFVTKLNATGSALTYSTYLGGSSFDKAFGIALDSSNNVYLGGTTSSSNFPTSSPFQAAPGGAGDAYVTKLNATGSALTYSTYLGGGAFDTGYDIAVDSSGSAYLTGYTISGNFPTSSPFQATYGGGTADVFVTKFNAAGSALTYSTYLGGSGLETGEGIDVDSSGNAYIVGQVTSTDFPTSSPYQAANAGGIDNFVTKLNAAGSALTYSTYLGGSADDYGLGVAVDSSGNAYTTGLTASTNFPTSSAYQSTSGGSDDTFVTKLNAAGSALTYSTYLGGSGSDFGLHLALSLDFDVYVAGQTSSSNFPTTSAFQGSTGGGSDAFVTLLTEHSVLLSAQVNPTLTFDLSTNSCALGTLSVSQTQFCTYTITAATNGTNGYTISYLPAATLTSAASDTISHLSSQTASVLGTEQFGFNLRANTAAGSNTAVDFGADPSGGLGTVAATYNTTNQFKFNTAGDTIASTTGPSVNTIFTVGTIANIASNTEAGAYTTTLTYNVVSGY